MPVCYRRVTLCDTCLSPACGSIRPVTHSDAGTFLLQSHERAHYRSCAQPPRKHTVRASRVRGETREHAQPNTDARIRKARSGEGLLGGGVVSS